MHGAGQIEISMLCREILFHGRHVDIMASMFPSTIDNWILHSLYPFLACRNKTLNGPRDPLESRGTF